MGAPYKTKKALKESVGQRFRYIETSLFGNEFKAPGSNTVVGPDPYTNRKWYATVEVDADGNIVKVS
jgi:hypothetical protein